MLNTIKAEICDLTHDNLKLIYQWRFKDYRLFFATQYIPTLQDHEEFINNELIEGSVSWFFGYFQGEIASCCSITKHSKEKKSHISKMTLGRVMVDPRWKGKGFAKQTISYGIKYMTQSTKKYEITLEVLNTNTSAMILYKKLGFVAVKFADHTTTMVLKKG